jgi:hypothetical protein
LISIEDLEKDWRMAIEILLYNWTTLRKFNVSIPDPQMDQIIDIHTLSFGKSI